MSLVLGTNCGFITTNAPTADPDEINNGVDDNSNALSSTAPQNGTIVEIGWWCDTSSEAGDYDVAIYDDDTLHPGSVIGSISTQAKGTDSGWKRATGLNITVSDAVDYWIAFQVDNVTTNTSGNRSGSGKSELWDFFNGNQANLNDPWGNEQTNGGFFIAVYALYGEAGTNMQINIGDAWKTVDGMQINIGDVWKTVDGAQINIGDAWKTIF